MKELKHLNKYLFKYRFRLALGILFITISNIFSLYPPVFIGKAFDSISESINLYKKGSSDSQLGDLKDYLFYYGGLVVIFALGKGFFMFLMRQTVIVTSRMIEYDLKNEIYEKYQFLNLSFYKKNQTGDLINRISEDVSKVRMYLGPAIMYSINLTILIILVVGKMYSVSPTLTFYTLSPLPILSITIYIISNQINSKSLAVQQQLSDLSSNAQESFSGIRLIKSFAVEKLTFINFLNKNEDYKNKQLSLLKSQSMMFPLMILLIGLSTVLTIYIGGKEVVAGNITNGKIAEFIIYINMLTWPVASLGWVSAIVHSASASQKRINEFLHEEIEIQNTQSKTQKLHGNITFKDLSFTYSDTGIKALNHVDFTINKGRTLGIIGKTGSGKSTIANLLCRLYEPSLGNLTIDNRPISELNLSSLRQQIAYVPQDAFLFSDTISNNIGFGVDEFDQNDIENAAKYAGVYDNIMKFPDGFETKIGERGVTLSGGQKQRIAIARAIMKNPAILILDDCLSAVDTETESRILQHLNIWMKDRTSIIIAHRISTIQNADQIIVLEDGRIIESGNHEELITKNGYYYKTFKEQESHGQA